MRFKFPLAVLTLATLLAPAAACATTLQTGPDAPLWARFGAAALLWLHIGGGSVGMIAGAVAAGARKGGPTHRLAGKVFFAAMFVAYLVGAGVAPFLTDGQRPNFTAGVLALYLLISGWQAVKRPTLTPALPNYAGLMAALVIMTMGLIFMRLGAMSPTGTIDGSPPQAFVIFSLVGGLAAVGELNLILRRGLTGAARLARHLWRMCFSWFFASGSFFFGQAQLLPEPIRNSPLPLVLGFAPLGVMIVYLVLVRLPKRRRAAAGGPGLAPRHVHEVRPARRQQPTVLRPHPRPPMDQA
ncbi:TRAP-type C4-dicarboxylate transport system permease small subunit [Caulobacter ginsengisoli]|uniref:TRAP-type C4-dicarboxylate transport system permease small subunit n=1 Tax=Caulobacter ginsengisoli TaxID=400775 RepID=A0ABU0IUB5_9CAUL|nr:hypothetical protein [Caulobacter ginsengisoli]MDQ0465594.1 TRAP-type C4-dicarboxylate transport system permease small subunit [Caulobacter ginsengisoli]